LVCAVLDFGADDDGLLDTCAAATALLEAKLAAAPGLVVVERSQLAAILAEQALALSGKAAEAQTVRAGRIIGADLLVFGHAMKSGTDIHLVARIVSTANTRTFGASEVLPVGASLEQAAANLAGNLAAKARGKRADLLAGAPEEDRQASGVTALLKARAFPNVLIAANGSPDAAADGLRRVLEHAGAVIATAPRQADMTVAGRGEVKAAVRRGQVWFCRAEYSFTVAGSDGKTSAPAKAVAGCVAADRETAEKSALEKAGMLAAQPAVRIWLTPHSPPPP
jgi:hypothetical protein